jgi:post-segregation antitoxin (ccd killing protein)
MPHSDLDEAKAAGVPASGLTLLLAAAAAAIAAAADVTTGAARARASAATAVEENGTMHAHEIQRSGEMSCT